MVTELKDQIETSISALILMEYPVTIIRNDEDVLSFRISNKQQRWLMEVNCYWNSFEVVNNQKIDRTTPIATLKTFGNYKLIEELFYCKTDLYETTMFADKLTFLLKKLCLNIKEWSQRYDC